MQLLSISNLMKWSRNSVWFLILICVVILVAWLLSAKKLAKNTQIVQAPVLAQAPITNSPTTDSSISSRDKAELASKLDRIREAGKSLNKPISFYGRVVDQFEQPVSGITIEVSYSFNNDVIQVDYMPHHQSIKLISNAAGEFVFEGESGLAMSVQLQPKAGYEFLDRGLLNLSFRDIGIGRPAPTISTRDTPYIFRAYRNLGAEPLFVGALFHRFPPDDRSYVVDLLARTVTPGRTGGDFIISGRRPPGPPNQQKWDWAFDVNGTAVELLEVNDEFLNLAPTDGYAGSWTKLAKATDTNYRKKEIHRFYFRRRANRIYGTIIMELFAEYDEDFAVRINYRLNPSGSRNLEYDAVINATVRPKAKGDPTNQP